MIDINKDNYEVIFFNLIEGEYNAVQRQQLIEVIEADTFLRFEWENWQKSMISEQEFPATIEGSLLANMKREISLLDKEDDNRKIVPFWFYTTSIAAGLLLLAVFYFAFQQSTSIPKPEKDLVNEIELPTPVNLDSSDSRSPAVQDDVKIPIVDHLEEKQLVSSGQKSVAFEEVSQQLIDTLTFETSDEVLVVEQEIKPSVESVVDSASVRVDMTELIAQIPREVEPVSPRRRLKFSVSTEDVVSNPTVFNYSYLEENNIDIQQLIADRRITVVRHNDVFCIKLVEENRPPILIALK